MRMLIGSTLRPAFAGLFIGVACGAHATSVTVETPLGQFEISLFDEEAPNTVANFLNYVNDGDYDGTFVHRSAPGFVIQGGGFTFDGEQAQAIETDPPVANEFGRSNTRGTIAMAKASGDPDSATSQWFINLSDNSATLDEDNGGYTVFGEVRGDGMQVVDAIAALPRVNAGAPFDNLPVINFSGGVIEAENLVTIQIAVKPEGEFAANEGLGGAWYDPETAGQGFLMDLFPGADGLQIFVAWFTYDVDDPEPSEPLTFGTSQHRWFTASGMIEGATAELIITANSGGVFNDPRATESMPVGAMTIEFHDCTTATLSFRFDSAEGGSDQLDIIRLTPDVFCEALTKATVH